MNANPAHRPAARRAFPNRCEHFAVPFHELMAVHAGLCGRNVRDGRNLNRGVTGPGNRDRARRREVCDYRGRAARAGSPRPCTTERRITKCPRRQASARGRQQGRPRSGACSTTGGRSGPRARSPQRRRPVARSSSQPPPKVPLLKRRDIIHKLKDGQAAVDACARERDLGLNEGRWPRSAIPALISRPAHSRTRSWPPHYTIQNWPCDRMCNGCRRRCGFAPLHRPARGSHCRSE